MSTPGTAAAPTAPLTVEQVVRDRVGTVLGGWRGSAETALPTVAFVVTWMATHEVRPAVVASVVATLVLAAVRLAQKQTVRYVASSVLATALAAFFALRTGRAGDAFLPGLINSGVWFVVAIASILARWPLVGFVVGAADPAIADDPFRWRRNHALVRVCSRLTWVLAGLYAVRLALMVPAYLANQVELLGILKVVLGWPLYLAALALMAGLILRGETPFEPGEEPAPAHPVLGEDDPPPSHQH